MPEHLTFLSRHMRQAVEVRGPMPTPSPRLGLVGGGLCSGPGPSWICVSSIPWRSITSEISATESGDIAVNEACSFDILFAWTGSRSYSNSGIIGCRCRIRLARFGKSDLNMIYYTSWSFIVLDWKCEYQSILLIRVSQQCRLLLIFVGHYCMVRAG